MGNYMKNACYRRQDTESEEEANIYSPWPIFNSQTFVNPEDSKKTQNSSPNAVYNLLANKINKDPRIIIAQLTQYSSVHEEVMRYHSEIIDLSQS